MITALNVGLNGLLMGLIYGLMALSLSVVFGVTRIVNFAHGEILVFGALIAITCYHAFGIHPFLVLPFLCIFLFVGGYFLQWGVINRLLTSSEHSQFIALSALAMIFLNLQLLLFGSNAQSVVTSSSLESIAVGPFLIDYTRLLAASVAVLATFLTYCFIYYTASGKAIRACTDHRFAALTIGLNHQHLYALSFAVAGSILGVTGCLFSLLMDISPQIGPQLTLLSFTIVIIGGLNNQAGALLGGMIVGTVEAYTAFYSQSSLKSLVSFGLLILVLLARPQGLLTRRL